MTGASAEQRTILIIGGLVIAILVILVTRLWFRGK